MKKAVQLISALCCAIPLIYLSVNAYAGENGSLPAEVKTEVIEVSQEMREKHTLRPVHGDLSFECVFCHEGQGDKAEDFEAPNEKVCMNCHKSKIYLAERLAFMDVLKVNPHNSVHDGPNLYCDECHREHEPSINMCAECHDKEIKENIWMGKVP